jgi:hypothetical protein
MSNVIQVDDPGHVEVAGLEGASVSVEKPGQVLQIESDCDQQVVQITDPMIVEVTTGDNNVLVIQTTDTRIIVIEGVGAQGPPGPTAIWENETFTIDATDVSNGYVDLSFVPTTGALFVFRNGIYQGSECYSLVGMRITWVGTRVPLLGQTIHTKYSRS